MSTPGNEFRQAEYLGLGFLAVTSSEILNRLLTGQLIDEDEKYTLRRAASFLKDVSSGAQLVNSGVSSNVSAVDTVRKLAYSVEPLKLMQDEIQSAEVEAVFKKMADAIEVALNSSAEVKASNDLIIAKDFFHQLHLFLVSLIEADQKRTGSDSSLDESLLAYA
ncbi:MAG: hypothetical protein KZQ76_02710 [Candidatus Thiodiazotropha sp. (ex Epidulcina cf. delphinae)]|nr:hypothetical protein [Candidatus Thiodiazotropha sp. (ex Epidulcina cf. delphinae)]